MTVHENVVLDLLPLVRSGQASSESRSLVEDYLQAHPQLAAYAALMPSPDPALELDALRRTRRVVSRSAWHKGMAIFFSLMPLSFIVDGHGFRFLFADYPVVMVGMLVAAAAFWAQVIRHDRRWSAPR